MRWPSCDASGDIFALSLSSNVFFMPTQKNSVEGCGGLRGENPGAFPKARSIFQQPFSLPENAQTLAGIAFCAAGKLVSNLPAASKFAGKLFQQRISDSHSLLEFSDLQFKPVWRKQKWQRRPKRKRTPKGSYGNTLRSKILGF